MSEEGGSQKDEAEVVEAPKEAEPLDPVYENLPFEP